MVTVDLVIDDGELVRIECPNRFEDELRESLEHAMKRRDFWAPGRFDRCTAVYLGLYMDRINMGRVVGMLG